MLPRLKLSLNCVLKNGSEFKTKVFSGQSFEDNARARILDVDQDYIMDSKIILAVVLENVNLTSCKIFLKGSKKKMHLINKFNF